MQRTSYHMSARRAAAGSRGVGRGVAALAALALLGLGAGCRSVPSTVATQESLGQLAANPIVSTTTDDIAGNAQRFVGRVVTVDGQVTRVFGPRWFAINSGATGARELLVLGSPDVPTLLGGALDSARAVGTRVRITGVVRAYEEDALEREVGGGLDLDGDVFDPFDATPVLVMANLNVAMPSSMAMPEPARPETVFRRMDLTPAMIVTERVFYTTGDLTTLEGRPATLFGVRVHEVIGPNAFTVHVNPWGEIAGTTGDSLLLVVLESDAVRGAGVMAPRTGAQRRAASATADVRAGQIVAVTGVLQPTSGDETSWRTRAGVTSQNEAMLQGRPLFLAANRVEILRSAQGGRQGRQR